MSYLGADEGSIRVKSDGERIYARWFISNSDLWQDVLDSFKGYFSPQERRYDAASKLWSLPARCRDELEEWAGLWFATSAQEWTDADAYDHSHGQGSRTGSSQNGYAHYTNAEIATLADAYRVLHLYPTAPPEVVAAAHRAMMRLTHPDAGGSHEASVALNRAIEVIRAHHERHTQ